MTDYRSAQFSLPNIAPSGNRRERRAPEAHVQYAAIFISNEFGTPERVTAGHRDVDGAKDAADRWCRERSSSPRLNGEIVVCETRDNLMREVLRRNLDGSWSEPER